MVRQSVYWGESERRTWSKPLLWSEHLRPLGLINALHDEPHRLGRECTPLVRGSLWPLGPLNVEWWTFTGR